MAQSKDVQSGEINDKLESLSDILKLEEIDKNIYR